MRLLEERLEYEGTNQVIIQVNKVIIMLSIHIAAQKLQIKGMYKISKSMVWSHFSIFSTCDWIFRQLNCKSRAVYKLNFIVDTPLRSWSQITVIRMLSLLFRIPIFHIRIRIFRIFVDPGRIWIYLTSLNNHPNACSSLI